MIKVGQIYQTERLEKYAVTRVIGIHFHVITSFGMTMEFNDNSDDDASHFWTLIAEYPTWQEAVNSKEFKNV